ncbi:MAG: class I SAM-dependent DNA methyltransferase [Bacteroidetes bacterium]|nr:class I SAM-dependent DNA methyltransferase [Bacteroidota bacterium]
MAKDIQTLIKKFVEKWTEKDFYAEDENTSNFWTDLLNALGVENITDFVIYQKKVKKIKGSGRIDVYLPKSKVLIEQKNSNVDIENSSDAFIQAKEYNDDLPNNERPNWIITCNFREFFVYDMNLDNREREAQKQKILVKDLNKEYHLLEFLIDTSKNISREMELSIKAGDLVGKMYDLLLPRYKNPEDPHTLQSLNQLCVRIVFCLFAEDAELFLHNTKTSFHDYLAPIPAQFLRDALIKLFNVLDTKQEERDEYLQDELKYFPYVNGGLFSNKNIEIPQFTEEIKELILQKASAEFDWSDISPTIFGAVFESTLNPETRRSGGMHYTSIENIHKVIDPLFLDDLKNELKNCKTTKELLKFQDKISKLTFLDPACGSGNFLTETYISLRNLENDVIRQLQKLGQANLINPIKVSINQFYGIEINDFAVSVAKTALWIAELQQQRKTNEISQDFEIEYLPLKEYNNIKEANALRIDWNDVIKADKLNYIIGNPPFIGGMIMDAEQKKDMHNLFGDKIKGVGELDYVGAWYRKAVTYMKNTYIKTAFVSSNSITQGEQVAILWEQLMQEGLIINFAWRTFIWDSESSSKAHVHCVIIGFSLFQDNKQKKIYSDDSIQFVNNINGYLTDAQNIFIYNRKTPICSVPEMNFGNMPRDGGGLILSEAEKDELISKEPLSKQWIHLLLGAEEYIKNKKRYCLWLVGANPSEIKQCPTVMKRIEIVRQMRLNSKAASTRKLAETPTLFAQRTQPEGVDYILVPRVSSENRKYVPMGFIDKSIKVNDSVQIIPNAELYHFGILTSIVHMAWMRTIAGRLKSDYRYSKEIVYNNFPWIEDITDNQKVKIEKTAQAILDARKLYSDSSLATLYDEKTMPIELRKAHNTNDREVLKLYGMKTDIEESEIVSKLFKMYQEKINEIK